MTQWIGAITRGHNGGAVLLKDGEIVFAIEEERLTRKKYDGGPLAAMTKFLDYTDKNGEITCSDSNKKMIEKGKKRLRGYKNIKWVVAEAEKLPFENDTFDFYTLRYLIDHNPYKIDKTNAVKLIPTKSNKKFKTLNEPYEGFHNMQFVEEFGPAAFTMRARAEGMRDFGPCMSPTNAFNILIGIETLSVRMEKHLSNTKIMVDYLSNNSSVSWVNHPSLPDHPDHKVAAKLMPKGAGSMIAFGIKGGKEAGHAFINSLKLTSHLANVGDAKSLVIHPASATHSQMDKKSLELAGLTEDMIRFSVGLEDMDDIINDFENGFRASQKPRLVASK